MATKTYGVRLNESFTQALLLHHDNPTIAIKTAIVKSIILELAGTDLISPEDGARAIRLTHEGRPDAAMVLLEDAINSRTSLETQGNHSANDV